MCCLMVNTVEPVRKLNYQTSNKWCDLDRGGSAYDASHIKLSWIMNVDKTVMDYTNPYRQNKEITGSKECSTKAYCL